MKKIVLLLIVVITQCFGTAVCAYELKHSAKTDSWDNPFIAFGYNPVTRITTGYLSATRTAPGRTDVCNLVFSNRADKATDFTVGYIARNGHIRKQGHPLHRASLVVEENVPYLKFSKGQLGGDCDWILPFVVETDVAEDSDEVFVGMEAQNSGKWISVYVIGAEKAQFHSRSDGSSAQKAFLVKGDVIYVYREIPGWYYVKYEEGKKKTEGWIKKNDTLQPTEG